MNALQNDSEKRTYRVEDIIRILDIGRSSAYELIHRGYFNTVKICTSIRVSKRSFDKRLDGLEKE